MSEQQDPHIIKSLRSEIIDRRTWQTRTVVLAFGILSGLTVVAFTWMTEHAFALFERGRAAAAWLPLVWTPLCTASVVWVTRRWAPGAAGSGIPQVMVFGSSSEAGRAPRSRGERLRSTRQVPPRVKDSNVRRTQGCCGHPGGRCPSGTGHVARCNKGCQLYLCKCNWSSAPGWRTRTQVVRRRRHSSSNTSPPAAHSGPRPQRLAQRA